MKQRCSLHLRHVRCCVNTSPNTSRNTSLWFFMYANDISKKISSNRSWSFFMNPGGRCEVRCWGRCSANTSLSEPPLFTDVSEEKGGGEVLFFLTVNLNQETSGWLKIEGCQSAAFRVPAIPFQGARYLYKTWHLSALNRRDCDHAIAAINVYIFPACSKNADFTWHVAAAYSPCKASLHSMYRIVSCHEKVRFITGKG